MIPIIIPLHPAGGKFGKDEELRFALRSLERHLNEPFKLIIIGERLPSWLKDADLIESGAGLKMALHLAAEAYPDGFFWWYDDLVLLRDSNVDDMKVTPSNSGWRTPETSWGRRLAEIKERMESEGIVPVDYSRPHGPYWFDREMIREGFKDWPGMSGKFPWESWILSKRKWPTVRGVTRQLYGKFSTPTASHVYLNFNDDGNTPELRAWLEDRFPKPSRFEKAQLRCALSFSLFGNDRIHNAGILENAKLAKIHYPEWEMVVHADRGNPTIGALRQEGVTVIEHEPEAGLRGTFWRFESISPKYDAVVCRDADCRLSARERAAVDDWLAKGTALHTMWDFKRPRRRDISAGMFGVRPSCFDMAAALATWTPTGLYGDDEDFLAARLWPALKDDLTAHRRTRRNGHEIDFPPVASVHHVGKRILPKSSIDCTLPVFRIGKAREGEIRVEPVLGLGQKRGNAMAHISAANKALTQGIFPCVILEEDAEWTLPPPKKWPGGDWLWIGLSKFELNERNIGVIGTPMREAKEGIIEMGRMCATHGLVYLSPAGALRMIESAIDAIEQDLPIDVGVIRRAEANHWERPGLAEPLVFQGGKNMRATRFKAMERGELVNQLKSSEPTTLDDLVAICAIDGERLEVIAEKDFETTAKRNGSVFVVPSVQNQCNGAIYTLLKAFEFGNWKRLIIESTPGAANGPRKPKRNKKPAPYDVERVKVISDHVVWRMAIEDKTYLIYER